MQSPGNTIATWGRYTYASMIRPLIVAVAHGLDLMTFLMAMAAFGIRGESNGLMQTVYLHLGPAGILALKSSGATALALISQLRGWALVPAAAAGIVGAAANLLALRFV
jgi:hypothetical protein